MSLTKSAGVYASVHERGLNRILDELKKQRPVWFNFGTDYFIESPDKAMLQPLATEEITPEDAIDIPGTGGQLGIDFIVQVGKTAVDFFPKTLSGYPPEIGLSKDQAVLKTELAVTLAYPTKVSVRIVRGKEKGWRRVYSHSTSIIATKLDVWAKVAPVIVVEPANMSDLGSSMEKKLSFDLKKLEIVDIKPDSLETVIETVCSNVIQWGFLQNLRLPVSIMVLDMFTIELDGGISPNPAIKGDRTEVWADVVLA
jgi:hypothetical protein